MASFIPGLNFSSASRAEISGWLLKQILDYMERDSACAKNLSTVSSNRATIFSSAKQAEKFHVIVIIFFIPGWKRNASMRINCVFAPQ